MINIPVNSPVFRPIHQLITEYYGTGYVPSIMLDFTTGTLDSRINFTRTTNATVTNSAGQITYAPHNLLLASEQFDSSSWVNNASSEQSNVILSPNNTITADKLIEDSTTDVHTTTQTLTKVASIITYTYSIYVKGGLGRNVQLSLDGGTPTNRSTAIFDITTGVVGSVLNFGTFTAGSNQIEVLSNGWYRCSLTTTTGTETSIRARVTLLNGTASSYAGDGTSGVYLWGAQLEIGSTATTYNSTTVKNLLGYSELFDNAAWTKSNSFVQTNLLTYSEAFDNAAWTKAYSTVTADTTLAPNGYQTADTLFETAVTQYHGIYRAVTVTNAIAYTLSVNMKPAGRNWARLTLQGTTEIGAYFDLVNGVLGTVDAGVTATITPAANGFYKCSVSRVADNVSTYVNIYVTTANNTTVYAGDITKGLYLWGAQLVQGSVAGDYRRTDAAALPVYYPNHNGVVCAEKLVENTAVGAEHRLYYQVPTLANSLYTFSIYAKKGERNILRVTFYLESIYFNLLNGTHSTPTSSSVSITPVGNDWYRCSVTYAPSVPNPFISVALSNTNSDYVYTGDGTSGIYIFGAQLSDSASLDPYVLNAAAAPTAAAYYGARFDYDPVTLAPKGLLIEEQRSNLCLYSGITSDSNWGVSNAIKVSTNNLAPDGSLTALLAQADGVSASHFVQTNFTTLVSYTSGTTYTFSRWVKAGTTNLVQITGPGPAFGSSQYANYQLTGSGSVTASTGGTATIQQYSDGWYKITFTVTATGTASDKSGTLVFITSGADTRLPTNTSTATIYVWGAQLEAGAFATSYIPTAASQVTRAADVATIQGSNFYGFYNQNESTLTAIADRITSTGVTGIACIQDSTGANAISVYAYDNTLQANESSSNIAYAQTNSLFNYTTNTVFKIAVALKVNDFAAVANNGTIVTDNSLVMPSNAGLQLNIGDFRATFTKPLNGHIKQISYYPQRLSNDVLVGLTR